MESPLRTASSVKASEFALIETLGWHPGEGLRRLDRHLARMGRSAAALGFAFDRSAACARLATVAGDRALRCRLTLAPDGALALTSAPLEPAAARWRLRLSAIRLHSDAPWLRHKTTRRALYDSTRNALPKGVDEVIFLNRSGGLCEGTITNIFVDLGEGLLTPPVANGLLPGVLREQLLESGMAREAALTRHELHRARAIFAGNSLRGLIAATLA